MLCGCQSTGTGTRKAVGLLGGAQKLQMASAAGAKEVSELQRSASLSWDCVQGPVTLLVLLRIVTMGFLFLRDKLTFLINLRS